MTDDTSMETGQYHVSRLIGRGGMAEVWEGRYAGAAGFERPICIKRILPHAATDPEFREMFVKEAKLAGKLNHSKLVQVFDCIEHGEDLSLVMELIDGGDLTGLIKSLDGKPMPVELVAHIGGEILEGLAYAHERRIIHRDISPHNILLSRHGEVKIADFGIAKAFVTHATMTGKLKGKLAYMSPEQLSTKGIDYRTDLYSTGLVLYELLTGNRFFEKTTQQRLIQLIAEAKRPKLTGIDPALAVVVERLLEPDPELRFGSAEEAIAAMPPWKSVGPLGARELGRMVRHVQESSKESEPAPPQLEPTAIDNEPTEVLPRRDRDENRGQDDSPTDEMDVMSLPETPEIPETVQYPYSGAYLRGDLHDTVESPVITDEHLRQRSLGKLWKILFVIAVILVLLTFGIGLGMLLPSLLQSQ